jgi:hypothetical protein
LSMRHKERLRGSPLGEMIHQGRISQAGRTQGIKPRTA